MNVLRHCALSSIIIIYMLIFSEFYNLHFCTFVFVFSDLDEITPNEFLEPFLDVIRSEETTGPITGLALTSVNKFLSYGLIGEQVSVTVSCCLAGLLFRDHHCLL